MRFCLTQAVEIEPGLPLDRGRCGEIQDRPRAFLDRAQRPHSSPPHHELLDEVKQAAAPAVASLGQDMRVEIDDLVGMLTGNLEKIAEHGRRADGIVKSMLEHSRGASSERREVSRCRW
jgi:hypothetical protein